MCSAVQLFYCQYSFIPWINLKILFYCWNQRFWLQRIDRIFATLQRNSNRKGEEQDIWRTRRRDAAPHHRECRAEELFGYFLNSQFHCLKKYYMKEEKLHSLYILFFSIMKFRIITFQVHNKQAIRSATALCMNRSSHYGWGARVRRGKMATQIPGSSCSWL